MAIEAMQAACRTGDLSQVQTLWETFCDEVVDFDGTTRSLLLTACQQRHAQIARFLLEHNAKWDRHMPIIIGKTVAEYPESCEIFSVFLDRGWDPNTDHSSFGTVLIQAIRKTNVPLIRLLLERGADPNLEYGKAKAVFRAQHRLPGIQAGMSPLHVAAGASTPECIQLLLDYGADLDRANPLHRVAAAVVDDEESRFPVINFLLDKGLDINAIERYPETSSVVAPRTLGTPLHYAARWQHIGRVKYLIKRGADASIEAVEGGTPLDWLRDMTDPENEDIDPELLALLKIEKTDLKT